MRCITRSLPTLSMWHFATSRVGANRDAAWLQAQVDEGLHGCALTLPPVTMEQFVRVCLQDKLMPPKSTWFVPKIRSGLVMAMV